MDQIEFYLEDLKSKFSKIDPTKYVLSYSGGRDSHFLYWFIKDYLKENKIKIVSVNTTMEHHQILERMIRYSDFVLHPTMKLKDIKDKYGIPCYTKMHDDFIDRYQRGSRAPSTLDYVFSRGRKSDSWFRLPHKVREKVVSGELHKVSTKCCTYLKKQPLQNFAKENNINYIIGVRSSESLLRKTKYNSCFQKNGNFTPIWDLTDDLMNEIYKRYNIETPEIYNHVSRTGCMGCPYNREWKRDLTLLTDQQYKYVTTIFKESYDVKGGL